MSIWATIYSSDMVPMTDGAEVSEDAEFEALEMQAAELAAAGTKCCIRWSRDSDGQTAYWGPKGATLQPHWYSRPGRPEEMAGGRKVNTYLDANSIAIAAKLGQGNVSEGIRIALSKAAE
jgi:hypothetical protein